MSHQRRFDLLGQGGQHDISLGGQSVLELLRRTEDRLICDQESTINSIKQYKDKLEVAEQEISSLSQQLKQQRNENARLKAQKQDDQRQIDYVANKVRIVQTYENMESVVNKLKLESNQSKAYYEALASNLQSKTSYCEMFVTDLQSLENAHQNALSQIQTKQSYIGSLQEQLTKLQKTVDEEKLLKEDALANVQSLETQQQNLKNELLDVENQLEELQKKIQQERSEFKQIEHGLEEQMDDMRKNISHLHQKESQLQKQQSQFEEELEHAFRKHQSDDFIISDLKNEKESLQKKLKDTRAHLKQAASGSNKLLKQKLSKEEEINLRMHNRNAELFYQLQSTQQFADIQRQEHLEELEIEMDNMATMRNRNAELFYQLQSTQQLADIQRQEHLEELEIEMDNMAAMQEKHNTEMKCMQIKHSHLEDINISLRAQMASLQKQQSQSIVVGYLVRYVVDFFVGNLFSFTNQISQFASKLAKLMFRRI